MGPKKPMVYRGGHAQEGLSHGQKGLTGSGKDPGMLLGRGEGLVKDRNRQVGDHGGWERATQARNSRSTFPGLVRKGVPGEELLTRRLGARPGLEYLQCPVRKLGLNVTGKETVALRMQSEGVKQQSRRSRCFNQFIQ